MNSADLIQTPRRIAWPDAVPVGARIHRFHWNKRERCAPRRLKA